MSTTKKSIAFYPEETLAALYKAYGLDSFYKAKDGVNPDPTQSACQDGIGKG